MGLYEGMFLVDNSEARKDYEGVSQRIASIIAKYSGEVKKSERWAERKLAYPVKKRDRGTYVLVYFDAPPDSIAQIKRDCVIDEVILRTMLLKVSAMPEEKAEPEAAPELPVKEKTPAGEGAKTEVKVVGETAQEPAAAGKAQETQESVEETVSAGEESVVEPITVTKDELTEKQAEGGEEPLAGQDA